LYAKLCHIRWGEVDMYNYLEEVTKLNTDAYKDAVEKYIQKKQEEKDNGIEIRPVDLALDYTSKNFPALLGIANKQVHFAPSEEVGKSPADLALQKLSGAVGSEDFTGNMNVLIEGKFLPIKEMKRLKRLITCAMEVLLIP